MNNELVAIRQALSGARSAKDVFGVLQGTVQEQEKQAKRLYRMIAKKTHPDYYLGAEKEEANEMFQLLTSWWQIAQLEIKDCSYGKGDDKFTYSKATTDEIKTKKNSYRVVKLYRSGDLSDVYHGEYANELGKRQEVAIKIAVDKNDNEFIKTEAKNLRLLKSVAKGRYEMFARYLPTMIETFTVNGDDGVMLQGNVLKFYKEFYTLAEVISAYPNGVDPRNMAWMWNRILEVIGFAHRNELIHGAVIPDHILVHPVFHSAKLIDWCTALESGRVKLMSVANEAYYAPEIPAKKNVTTATDIFMSAQCMIRLLGAKNIEALKSDIPQPIKRILKSCVVPAISKRPDDAWELRDEFEQVLEKLYGKRSYCEFKMPGPRK